MGQAMMAPSVDGTNPSTDFSTHSIVKPKLQHGRTKRHITSTRDTIGSHHREITVIVSIDGEEHELDLRLNEALVPRGHALIYDEQDGRTRVHVPDKKDLNLCQYAGHIRGKAGSWAAVSTCRGVKGVIYDGRQLRYIEPAYGSVDAEHFLYSHEHLTKQHRCGNNESPTFNSRNNPMLITSQLPVNYSDTGRYKRQTSEEIVRKPYNADTRSRYVELVLVVDNGEFLASGSDLDLVHQHMKDLANILNSVYAPLNIFIALVGVEVWTKSDKILLTTNSDTTLDNFNKYRSSDLAKRKPNDNAHLITRQNFDNGIVGKAYTGTICTNKMSAGVETNHSSVLGIVAMTVAHEMGHNFGMLHDEDNCKCFDKKCIMMSTSDSMMPARWSSCSLRDLRNSFEKGLDYCLRNIPEKLFESSTCGNGFLEEGEQCDCGTAPGALSPADSDRSACTACCRPDCTLRANATCGHGHCCDLTTCRPKATGTECRATNRECDLPEFCNGKSQFCPRDVHKMDATPCGKGEAYCVRGSCRGHAAQCRLLWGASGARAGDACYTTHNVGGDEYGNCGYDPITQRFRPCAPQDSLCGMLQCSHLGRENKIEFGDFQTARVLSYPVYDGKRLIIPCHMAIIDLGLHDMDPGLVPDGAKCGPNKMCMQQQCLPVERVRNMTTRAAGSVCPSDCSGHGVCNSNGNCHCEAGYVPPLCATPGAGGSYDSGPIIDNTSIHRFMVAMYIIFLGIVPGILLLLLLIYCFPCCVPLSLKIFKSHYKKSAETSKFTLPSCNSIGNWFYEKNYRNCAIVMTVDRQERKIVIAKNELDGHEYKEERHTERSSRNVAKSAIVPAQSKKNVDNPIILNRKINKEDIVIVEKYNHAEIHKKAVDNNFDVNKLKVDQTTSKESLSEQKTKYNPNFKDLNKELAMLKNSKIGSPIGKHKPGTPNTKPNLSPKPSVSPKPKRLTSQHNPKPEIINTGLVSTTNEYVNQRSKLRKVGDINAKK